MRSFRLVTAHLVPRGIRCKQALLLGALILAGCGGSSAPKAPATTLVRGAGFTFRVPAGWDVTTAKGMVTAKSGGDRVQVATFPLARAYTAALFTKVATELADRMATVAQASGGTVTTHQVVEVDGAKAHQYDVKVDGKTLRYTFVLRGKREFLLLCSAADAVCRELAASFSAG